MANKRRKSDPRLPKYVHKDKSRYFYKPPLPNGKRSTPIRLCHRDASIPEVWEAYRRVLEEDRETIGWLIDQYLDSPKFQERAQSTQARYLSSANTLRNYETRSGKKLGEFPISSFSPKTAQAYLDNREAKISANREIEFLSSCFAWAKLRLTEVDENPCVGVDWNREIPRDRYVTDAEYKLVYDLAKASRSKYMHLVMEIIYLCRARPNEAYLMPKSAIRDEGLYLHRGKGSASEITGWSDRLETVVIEALETFPSGPLLFYNERGDKISKTSFDSARVRLMKLAMKKGLSEPFTFHDLKAKGVSDHAEKRINVGVAGHRSAKMLAVYDRVPGITKSTR